MVHLRKKRRTACSSERMWGWRSLTDAAEDEVADPFVGEAAEASCRQDPLEVEAGLLEERVAPGDGAHGVGASSAEGRSDLVTCSSATLAG